jgi:hypothetical protein
MRKIAVTAVVVVLAAASAVLFFKYRTVTSEMKTAEAASQSRYAETINAIFEIQDSLSAISLGDTTVKLLSQSLNSEQGLSGPNGQEALDRIADIRGSIMRSKERIHLLEADMKKRGIKIAGMQKMIAGLRTTVSAKEELIAQLSGAVDSLHTQVTSLSGEVEQEHGTIAEREQTIEERRRELATVYYIAAPKKKLVDSGAVIASGGFLGLGKTVQPSRHIVDKFLTALDTDQNTVIELPTAKAQVLSAQPTSSYELKLVDGKMELHSGAEEFRKIVSDLMTAWSISRRTAASETSAPHRAGARCFGDGSAGPRAAFPPLSLTRRRETATMAPGKPRQTTSGRARMTPISKKARIAGLFYLSLVLVGPLRLLYIPAKLFVHGDAAATAGRIAAHETLFRLGIASEAFGGALLVFVTLAFYRLFKDVDRDQAVLVVILGGIMPGLLYFVDATLDSAALILAKGADYLSVFDKAQQSALAYLFIRINSHLIIVSEVLWGLWLLPLGILAYRSRFLPRFLGVWLIVNGITYVGISITGMFFPDYSAQVFNLSQPVLFGEVAFMLWLVIMGAKEPKVPATAA